MIWEAEKVCLCNQNTENSKCDRECLKCEAWVLLYYEDTTSQSSPSLNYSEMEYLCKQPLQRVKEGWKSDYLISDFPRFQTSSENRGAKERLWDYSQAGKQGKNLQIGDKSRKRKGIPTSDSNLTPLQSEVVGEGAYLCLKLSLHPHELRGTSSWGQVLIAAGLIISLERGFGSHPACWRLSIKKGK